MPAAIALCLIVAISDGDTLTARCDQPGEYEQVKIRISAIDAPERGQPWSNRSRQSLAALCHQQQATITPRGQDRYRRTIADVECQGQDAATHQVSNGMAWVYDHYAKGYGWLYATQDTAKAARLGLWQDAQPIAPWEWRKTQAQSNR